MATVKAAAIYARISKDSEGAGAGVARQVADCRDKAAQLGWPVAEVYEDNDFSAYSGKARPAFQRMLADIGAGAVDAVVIYHVDRLTRRPIELEQFLQALDAARVRAVRFVIGDSDLMTGDGLLVVRMLAAVAANESAAKSRRVKRKFDQNAAEGKPHGGSQRPFGYEADRVTVRRDEAKVIKALAARYLAGESLRSLAGWLTAEQVPTVGGGGWRSPTIRLLLRSGRIAGLREHRGQVVGRASWPAIITPQQRDQIIAKMDAGAVSGRRAPRRYLLSGLLRCGKCGGLLYSQRRETTRRYVCQAGPDHGGCGRLTVVAEPVEDLITTAIQIRLSSPDLVAAINGRASGDEEAAELTEAIRADREKQEHLSVMWSTNQITHQEWMAARGPIQDRITAAERRLSRLTSTTAIDGLVGLDKGIEAAWDKLNLDRRHAIIATVLDHAVIAPGVPGSRTLDPNRVEPQWKL